MLIKRPKSHWWHRWFAWYPVRVAGGDFVWLEHVGRYYHFDGFPRCVDYRREYPGQGSYLSYDEHQRALNEHLRAAMHESVKHMRAMTEMKIDRFPNQHSQDER